MYVSCLEAGERRFHVSADQSESELAIGDILDAVDTPGEDAVVDTGFAGTVPSSGA